MKFTRSTRSRPGGFTLVELLIATAVVAVLMCISIPAFSRWVPGYKLRGATRDLYSDFALARMTAVNVKGECAVVFNPGTNQYCVWACGPNRVFDNAGGDDVLLKKVNLGHYGQGIRYGSGKAASPVGGTFGDGVTFQSNRVVFDPRGTVKSATGGYAYLQNSLDAAYAVGVVGSGIILLKRWTRAGWQ